MAEQLERLKTALADRYAIQEEIGAGGMATVYLAEDLKHHRKVAVKVLRPELAATLGPERFLREIEIAAGLTHPHSFRCTTRATRTVSCITSCPTSRASRCALSSRARESYPSPTP